LSKCLNRKKLKLLIQSHGIKQSWIAEKIGIKTQTLSFLLDDSEKFDDELYKTIKDVIDKYQYDFRFRRR
jgi:DNA-binding XRE family transcriptional regulator